METKRTIDVTCPDCGGPISEIQIGDLREYRCLVGHTYSARSILAAHSDIEERALWSAVVSLEEAAILARTVAALFAPAVAAQLEARAEERLRLAADVKAVLNRLDPFHLDRREPPRA